MLHTELNYITWIFFIDSCIVLPVIELVLNYHVSTTNSRLKLKTIPSCPMPFLWQKKRMVMQVVHTCWNNQMSLVSSHPHLTQLSLSSGHHTQMKHFNYCMCVISKSALETTARITCSRRDRDVSQIWLQALWLVGPDIYDSSHHLSKLLLEEIKRHRQWQLVFHWC